MKTAEDRAKIKQQRIVKYFIEAANEIIEDEGIGTVTIRKAAERAGYTSATLYNYFDNLQHLVFLATMNYLEEYMANVPKCIEVCNGNSIERYMAICKCFSEHSYEHPDIYELLFFTHSDEKFEEYIAQYYELFPDKVVDDWPEPLSLIYHFSSIYRRNYVMIERWIGEGFITEENGKDFNDIGLRISKSVLQDVKEGYLKKNEATDLTVKYYFQMLDYYMKPKAKPLLAEAARKLGYCEDRSRS